jgi:hypothetical protein
MEGHPNILVPLALVGFIPVVVACFLWLGPRRAMLATILGGWLFLPQYDHWYDPPLLRTKAMFVPAVVLVVSLLLDMGRWRRLRPRLVDVPLLVLCVAPFVSALSNGLGYYEASSAAFEAVTTWGAPYLLARVYFKDPGALPELAVALVVAALVYSPFCLWEIRMSPQLHRIVYGFSPFGMFVTVMRFGGFRPTVFMSTGLAVGMFMACGTLSALWLWRTGARRKLGGLSLGWVSLFLVAVTLLCKSTGSIILLAGGYLALEMARRLRTSALILLLLAAPPTYCVARLSGWTGEPLVTLARRLVNEERAQSMQFRLMNEDMLISKAMKRPWFGWGRFGRSRVRDEEGQDVAITDGMWIVNLGVNGITGLVALGLLLALPALQLLRRFPARYWSDPRLAPAGALVVAVLVWAVDDLFNAMMTPVFPVIAGAVTSFCLFVRRARARRPSAVHLRQVVPQSSPSPGE